MAVYWAVLAQAQESTILKMVTGDSDASVQEQFHELLFSHL